jgi:L-threonylcarbamoyladenylate synthase
MESVSPGAAAVALRAGKVVLVPTETVVGLVAPASGLPRVREIKGREANKPIALLCYSAEEALGLAVNVPRLARELADIYWPGPLTLILDLPGGETVGVRVPSGDTVRELLKAYGGPLYATSANLSGKNDSSSVETVDPEVLDAVDVVVEGEAGSGEASAIVDLSGGRARLLRPTRDLSEERLAQLAELSVSRSAGG